jgi:two-component system, CAI-1 autoinducer sensor kinase/phosphatase CqsS
MKTRNWLDILAREWKSLKDWIVGPEIEIILHPSRRRLQMIGIFTVTGHLLFWWLWTYLLPQPFEDWRMRILMAASGLGFIFQKKERPWFSPGMQVYFSIVCWLQLPFFFIWMYFMNSNSSMWMATVAVMIVAYHHLTDWRLASGGLVIGFLGAAAFALTMRDQLVAITPVHMVVFAFAWISALLLALSSANLRRERLQHALTVIGIMAHELRTPLATMALIAQAMRNEADTPQPSSSRLEDLAHRIETLTRAINHHIDLQMANARYTQPLPHYLEQAQTISARELVDKVLHDYPFDSRRERECAVVSLHDDFWFQGSPRQFTQVLNNLIKNALHSLKAAQSRYAEGDLCIELGRRGSEGRIQITDRGIGIDAHQLHRIFEPFYSTASETGHGLGLAFCKQVVQAAGGQIFVTSEPAMGASFTLQLPCQSEPPTSPHEIKNHEISSLSPS